MTKEEIMEMNMEQLEERRSAIVEEIETADAETLESLSAELDSIENRKCDLKQMAEEKRAEMLEVINGDGNVIEEQKEEERKTMDNIEIRKSAEYLDAWVEYIKGRATEEQRTLLTTNANANGTIAVPTYVEERIHTAWENNDLMRRIRRTYFKGNLKVGYEASADGAHIHEEGAEAITEEALVIGFVELIPKTVKKMVRYSTEVLDTKGQAFVDYIVDEIEYQIVKAVGNAAIYAMIDSTLSATITGASKFLTMVDIINAEATLGGEASNPVIITTRANAGMLKVQALEMNYAYDPFDGMDVIYCDASALGQNAVAIVADLSGVQANFPDGDDVKFVFDEFTEAAADVVRVIGRLYVGVDVVAPGKVAVINVTK